MVIHLHVGANRAGSSAIQHFCRVNTDLLSTAGFVYPQLPALSQKRFAAAACNGADLSYYYANELPQDADSLSSARRLTKSIESIEADHIIISSEFLFDLRRERLALLRDALKASGHRLRVYAYIREPYEWLVSTYAQRVKSRALTVDINEYLSSLLPEVRFGSAIDDLHSAFGDEIKFLLYRRDRLVGGDVRLDFFKQLGLELPISEMPPEANRSANATEIETMRHLNCLIEMGAWSRRSSREFLRLTERSELKGLHIRDFVSESVEKAIRDRFDPEVAELKARHFPQEAGPLFEPPKPSAKQSLVDFAPSKVASAITSCLRRELGGK